MYLWGFHFRSLSCRNPDRLVTSLGNWATYSKSENGGQVRSGLEHWACCLRKYSVTMRSRVTSFAGFFTAAERGQPSSAKPNSAASDCGVALIAVPTPFVTATVGVDICMGEDGATPTLD